MIGSCRPAWGVAGPRRDCQAERVAWLTYVSAASAAVPPLEAPVTVSSMKMGTLVQLFPEAFDADDAAHRGALAKLERDFRAAGVIERAASDRSSHA
jgi:hypothetical protein